jgi:CheY-like chemotaxis protein
MACIGRNPVVILVVDDSPEIRSYLRALLELDSYRVETASSGQEALQAVRHARPDLVLLDVQMPGMDGIETLRRLQQLRPKPKVIMCSGVDNPDTVHEALSLGAHTYLLKPVQHLYLSAAVERCLHGVTSKPPKATVGAQLFVLPSPGRCEPAPASGHLKS